VATHFLRFWSPLWPWPGSTVVWRSAWSPGWASARPRRARGGGWWRSRTGSRPGLCQAAAGDHLFTDGAGRRLSQVDDGFRKACGRAGLSGFRLHDLRHEYGSRLGDADVNLKKIARLMGHSDTKMTERYVHPDEDSLLAATEIAARPGSRIVPGRLRVVG
jgi:integrase